MNIFKKLFGKKSKVEVKEAENAIAEKKEQECWYNNAHDNGEIVENPTPFDAAGSENFLEAALTKSAVRE